MKYFKVAQLIEAMEINGYKRANGSWIRTDSDVYGLYDSRGNPRKKKINAACVMGQGALNTGVSTGYFADLLERAGISSSTVMHWNDGQNLSIPRIVAKLKKEFADIMDREVPISDDAFTNYSDYENYQGVKVTPRKKE